ncbi:MAG: TonB-dependent receptor [Balneolaceae bacterium]|nr:MAG: TonB-dependent receptor [Balneolaceae bacterium]
MNIKTVPTHFIPKLKYLTCLAGLAGLKGQKGLTALAGLKGLAGLTGLTGLTALKGFTGLAGTFLALAWSPVFAQTHQMDDEIELVHEQTLETSISKHPGFYLDLDRNLVYRGLDAARIAFTLNGMPLAVSTPDQRGVLTAAFTPDAFRQVVIRRSLNANQWAAPAGVVIDLQTMSDAPVTGRSLVVAGGVGTFTDYGNYGAMGSRAAVQYSGLAGDDLGVGINLAYQNGFDAFEQLNMNYVVSTFNGSATDFLRNVSPSLQFHQNEKLNGNIWLDYQPNAFTRLRLTAGYTQSSLQNDIHRRMDETMGDWINPGESGATGAQGFTMYEAFLGETGLDQLDVQARGSSRINAVKMDYGAYWSQAVNKSDNLTMPFRRDGINFLIDFENRARPFMEIANIPTLENGTVDYRNMRLAFINEQLQENTNNQLGTYVDVSLPDLNLKAGVSARVTLHDGFYEEADYSFFQVLNLYRFFMIPQGSIEVFNQPGYLVPWLIETDYARSFFRGNTPRFNRNEDQVFVNSEFRNFELTEGLYAAHISGSVQAGALNTTAGVRYEYTSGTYRGFDIAENGEGDRESETLKREINFGNLFPFFRADITLLENTGITAGYSRGIYRPGYFKLTPFSNRNEQTGLINRGNSRLKPEFTDNLDVGLNWQPIRSTSIRAGGFYMIWSDAISQAIIQTDDSLPVLTWLNADETISIYGFESSLRHRFSYLPRTLDGLALHVHYTWTRSDYTDGDRSGVPFPGQREHVINGGLSYEYGRFSGTVHYQFASGTTLALATEPTQIPSQTDPVYLDLKESEKTMLSAAMQFRISDNFTFWADAWNLLNQTQTVYQYSEKRYPALIRENSGFYFRTGIRYQL